MGVPTLRSSDKGEEWNRPFKRLVVVALAGPVIRKWATSHTPRVLGLNCHATISSCDLIQVSSDSNFSSQLYIYIHIDLI